MVNPEAELSYKEAGQAQTLLELLSVTYDIGGRGSKQQILSGIEMSVSPRQAVSIVGESGCGKSTLLRLIAGLEEPTDGRVVFGGHTVWRPNPRRPIMFQEASLLPWLSIWRNVRFGLELQNDLERVDERVRDTLQMVGLKDAATKSPSELSGGMAQRVALARALVTEPELMLLDEPFSALDVMTRRRLQSELGALRQEQGFGLVLVTHDIEEAVMVGDTVLVMQPEPGRIAGEFPVADYSDEARASDEFQAVCREIEQELKVTVQNGGRSAVTK
jgi:ABC-type nitrate/sulfonate/bicarbonate transport system ATPase subunit